jgi:biopolymer transport protein ExbD
MGMAVGGGKGPKSEINMTPLIDVLLVLADHLHGDYAPHT